MEKSSKRGKIPQHDWPSIISRYESGETLASIARTYDCSPPAISYIVSRTRARDAVSEESAAKTEPLAARIEVSSSAETELVKGSASTIATANMADNGFVHTSSPDAHRLSGHSAAASDVAGHPARTSEINETAFPDRTTPPAPRQERPITDGGPTSPGDGDKLHDGHPVASSSVSGAGTPRMSGAHGGSPSAGEPRRTLHLSLPQGNGAPVAPVTHSAANSAQAADSRPSPHLQGPPGFAAPARPAAAFGPSGPPGTFAAPPAAPAPPNRAREGSAFIDQALRDRINEDIAAFLAAFDAALAQDTAESRTALREATDRLLRAGARTRIELERLEARIPLPSRDGSSRPPPSFRQAR